MNNIENEPIKLDELDYAILAQLIDNGRESFLTIAKRLGVSVNTVSSRVNNLVESQAVRFFARVNPQHVGFNSTSEVEISITPSNLIEKVAYAISEFPELSFLAMISGDADLLAEVVCRDQGHLFDVISRLHNIEGVEKTKILNYLKLYKWNQPDLGKIREQRRNYEINETPEKTARTPSNR